MIYIVTTDTHWSFLVVQDLTGCFLYHETVLLATSFEVLPENFLDSGWIIP